VAVCVERKDRGEDEDKMRERERFICDFNYSTSVEVHAVMRNETSNKLLADNVCNE
jgi:hypothetical protein